MADVEAGARRDFNKQQRLEEAISGAGAGASMSEVQRETLSVKEAGGLSWGAGRRGAV